jgi:transposase-like protein
MIPRTAVLSRNNLTWAYREIKAFEWEGEFKVRTRQALKKILEDQMEEDLAESLGFDLYQRGPGRLDYRNGAYTRHLVTEIGDLVLKVPRLRNHPFYPKVLERYARRQRSVDEVILSCFVLGLSTRKAAEVLGPMLGETISASTVSRIAQCLDAEVKAYHARSLKDQYRFLFFDGVVLKSQSPVGVKERVFLCALGITKEGVTEMIDFAVAHGESQNAWEKFLNTLHNRGLTGQGCELAVTDGGTGLHTALDLVYPEIPRQRCWAHKVRNVLDKVKKEDWKAIKRDLHKIWNAPTLRQATRAYWDFAGTWRKTYPKAVRCVEKDLEDLLQFLNIKSNKLWKKIRTTNLIERAFREVRRRTRPMGVFGNKPSVERIVYAVFCHLNHNWTKHPLREFTQLT